jgi:acyl carrier protein
MDDYWQRQLSSFLITEFNSVFKRPMLGRRFFGEVSVGRIVERPGSATRQPLVIVYSECRYWPYDGTTHERVKYCHGTVKVAITDPHWRRPAPAAGAPAPAVQRLLALPRSERRAALEGVVVPEFRAKLLMSADEPLPLDANYFDLGLTSLQATEIKQRLEALLGCEIDASALLGRPTVEQLMNHLAAEGLPEVLSQPAGLPTAELPTVGATVDAARVAARRPMVDELIQHLYQARS